MLTVHYRYTKQRCLSSGLTCMIKTSVTPQLSKTNSILKLIQCSIRPLEALTLTQTGLYGHNIINNSNAYKL